MYTVANVTGAHGPVTLFIEFTLKHEQKQPKIQSVFECFLLNTHHYIPLCASDTSLAESQYTLENEHFRQLGKQSNLTFTGWKSYCTYIKTGTFHFFVRHDAAAILCLFKECSLKKKKKRPSM